MERTFGDPPLERYGVGITNRNATATWTPFTMESTVDRSIPPEAFTREYMQMPYYQEPSVRYSLRDQLYSDPSDSNNLMDFVHLEREQERHSRRLGAVQSLEGQYHSFLREHHTRPNALFLTPEDYSAILRSSNHYSGGLRGTSPLEFMGMSVIYSPLDKSYVALVNNDQLEDSRS